jgi:NADH-quinone oxidoreductase subunit N
VLILSLLSLVGIPPLAGFVGKLALFAATIDGDTAWLAAVAVANTVLSLAYYLRVVAPMVFAPPAAPVHVLDRPSGVAIGIGAALIAGVGVAAHYPLAAFATVQLLP